MGSEKLLLVIMLVFILNFSFISAEEFGYNLIEGPIFNNNTAFVNSTQNWITNVGVLTNVDAVQHNNVGGTLTISETYLRSFGDGEWLALNQNNWFNGSNGWNIWDGDSLNFNESKLDPFINSLGYNHTENLTVFYDARYLTGELALYFYNSTSPLNSSYTIMNTTIPTGTEQRER